MPHIVAPLKDSRNAKIAALAGGHDVEWVHTGDSAARLVAQTCRQSGLSVAYTELMDFGGDEMHIVEQPELPCRARDGAAGAGSVACRRHCAGAPSAGSAALASRRPEAQACARRPTSMATNVTR